MRCIHRSTLVVRLQTDEGVVGEAYVGDEDAALLEIERIVREEIAPRIIGEDVFALERTWQLARPATFDILRDRRLGLVACAGIDTALWDAVGKCLGQPLWRLWGGFRNSIPMISIGGYYSGDADIPAEVADLREKGLAGMKFKVGGWTPAGREAISSPCAAGAHDFVLMADAGLAVVTTRGDALRATRRGLRPALVRGALPVGQ